MSVCLWIFWIVWVACGLIISVWAVLEEGELTFQTLGLCILIVMAGPLILVIWVFDDRGLGRKVIWKRKSRPNESTKG